MQRRGREGEMQGGGRQGNKTWMDKTHRKCMRPSIAACNGGRLVGERIDAVMLVESGWRGVCTLLLRLDVTECSRKLH